MIPLDIFWWGNILLTQAKVKEKYSIDKTIAKEVIWELMNHNFVLELLVLDHIFFNNYFFNSILIALNYLMVNKELGALCWQNQDRTYGGISLALVNLEK